MKKRALFTILAVMSVMAFAGAYDPAYSGDAAAGKIIFEKQCFACHGKTGKGDGPMSAYLNPKPANFSTPGFLSAKSDDDLKTIIKGGKSGVMPPFAVFSDQQVSDVIAFIRGLTAK